MNRVGIGDSDLKVFPINLGGNVFGWTADAETSHAVLDAYVEAGGNFIDTADVYSAWVEGHSGGESETVLGGWLEQRSDRDSLVIATKVGAHPARRGLDRATVNDAVDDCLRRLRTDRIDLLYAHVDDSAVPIEDVAVTFSDLVKDGKVRYPAISNLSVDRAEGWMRVAIEESLAAPVAIQPLYNLMERGYETTYRDLAIKYNLAVMPYNAMARGFLTGKYKPGVVIDSPRAETGYGYLQQPRGRRVIAILEATAGAHSVHVGSVALAWLAAAPTVTAPVTSARSVDQLPTLLDSVSIKLSADEIDSLDRASQDADSDSDCH